MKSGDTGTTIVQYAVLHGYIFLDNIERVHELVQTK